ncbi:hypothetical protein FWH30_02095 [Microgenomates group bacterium]|nr:hypothetical protein [Microgenomates group bacterium]
MINLNESQKRRIQKKVDSIFIAVDKAEELTLPNLFVQPFAMLAAEIKKMVEHEGVGISVDTEAVKNIPETTPLATFNGKHLLKAAFAERLKEIDAEFFGGFLVAAEEGEDEGEEVEDETKSGEPDKVEDALTTLGLKIVDQLQMYGNPIIPSFNSKGEGAYQFRATYYQEIVAGGKPAISDFKLTMLIDGKPAKKSADLADDGSAFLSLAVLSGLTLRPEKWDANTGNYSWGFALPYYLRRVPTQWTVEFGKLQLI